MSAKYKSPSFLLPNEINTNTNPLNTDDNPATGTGVNSLYSMEFDGSSDYIDTNTTLDSSYSSLTLSAWVNYTSISDYSGTIFGQWIQNNNSGSTIICYTVSNKIQVYLGPSATPLVSTTTLTTGTWYNVILRFDGSTMKLYINGTEEDSISFTSINNSAQNLILGAYSNSTQTGYQAFLNGKIDEVAIFNRALNTTEIAALYGGTSPNIYPSNLMATDLNPIAYYPLGEQAQMQGYLGNEASSEWQFPNGVLQDYVMDFDGTDNINSEANISSASSFTASIWINRDDSATQYIYGQWVDGTTASQSWVIQTVGGIVYFNVRDASLSVKSAISTTSLTTGVWYNIIAVWTGSNVKLYINNSLEDTTACSSMNNPSTAVKLAIGSSSNNVSPFNGKISNAVIWNSDQESNRDNIYNNGSPQTTYTVTPQNWWKLNATSVYTPSAPNYTTALDFVASESDYIDLGTTTAYDTGDLSVSVWVNASSSRTGTVYAISSSGSTSYAGFDIAINTSEQIRLRRNTRTQINDPGWVSIGFTEDAWQHLAFTYNESSNTLKLFLNGVLKNTTTGTSQSAAVSRKLTIGSYTGTLNFFGGQLSNASIWNTTLSDSQISTLFNFGTPETNISFSPQAWWKLDNTTTGIQDSSGNGNNGTNNGATDISSGVAVVPSWKIPSALPIPTINYTTALDFDGNTNYVTAGTTSYLNNVTEMSLSIWFNLDTAAQNKGLISDFTYPATGHFALVSKGVIGNNYGLRLYMNNGGPESSINISNQPFTAGQWHNLVMTYANSTINFYIDGQSAASSAYSGTTPSSFANSTTTLNIGKYATLEWDGLISNAQIWTTELSSSDALSIYNNGQPSTTAFGSPVSWWKLDSTTITDSAGSNNGTNNGATQVTSDVYAETIPVNGVSTTLPSTALQQSDLQFDSPYSNYSLSFDGTGDYIDFGNVDSIKLGDGDFTFSTWINPNSWSSSFEALYTCLASNGVWIGIDGTNFVLRIVNGSNIIAYSTLPTVNTWTHICITRVSGSCTLYYDSSSVATATSTHNFNVDANVNLGGYGTYGNFNGKIDETSIFNYGLSDAQILEIYNNGKPDDITSLSPISWWRLGENAYFNDVPAFTVPNSITGAPNGTGSGSITTMISADAPGTYANGIGTNLAILDRVGDAPLSTSNSQSYNMIPSDISPYVPQYVGNQIANNFSMSFDSASSTYFNAGNSITQLYNGAFTISYWVKQSNLTGNQHHIMIPYNQAAWSNPYSRLMTRVTSSGSLEFRLDTFQNILSTATGAITSGNWHHICCTFDGTTNANGMKIYIDAGSPVTKTSPVSSITSTTNDLFLGTRYSGGANEGLNGQIDEVAIFDKALTADQVKFDLYQPSFPAGDNKTADIANNPNLPTPVAWYRMGD